MAKKRFLPDAQRTILLSAAAAAVAAAGGASSQPNSASWNRRRNTFTRCHMFSVILGVIFLGLAFIIGICFKNVQDLIQSILRWEGRTGWPGWFSFHIPARNMELVQANCCSQLLCCTYVYINFNYANGFKAFFRFRKIDRHHTKKKS